MRKLIVLILLVTIYCNGQDDGAFVTYKFLRTIGVLKRDSGSVWMTPTMIQQTIDLIPGGTPGVVDTANLVLSKQNARDNYTPINDERLSDTRVPRSHTHSESDITGLSTDLSGKQETLVSGTNIKTINSTSILGSGDIAISGSGNGYCLNIQAASQSTTTDAQTLYWGGMLVAPSTTAARWRVYIPKAGTIKAAYIFSYAGTAGTNEAWVMSIRKNNTSDTQIASITLNTNARLWSNTELNISVVAGDYIEIKEVLPTWATNPATVTRTGQIYVE